MEVPVTKADLAVAQRGHYEATELEKEIDRQRACGLDCDEDELRCRHLKEFFAKYQSQYGPLVSPVRKT